MGAVWFVPFQLLPGRWLVVTIRTLITFRSVMDKHLAPETRKMLHLDPVAIAMKCRDFSTASLTARIVERAFDLDVNRFPLEVDLQYLDIVNIQGQADLNFCHFVS